MYKNVLAARIKAIMPEFIRLTDAGFFDEDGE